MWWWKTVVYPLCGAALVSVVLARVYIATHFPHQCLIGALVGEQACVLSSNPILVWVAQEGRSPDSKQSTPPMDSDVTSEVYPQHQMMILFFKCYILMYFTVVSTKEKERKKNHLSSTGHDEQKYTQEIKTQTKTVQTLSQERFL